MFRRCADMATTGVFWDVEDFPVPPGGDLNLFHGKILSSLGKEGYVGPLSIKAYSKRISFNELNEYRMTDIGIEQQADSKLERLNKILMDMLFWAHDEPPSPNINESKNFMVIVDDIKDEDTGFEYVLQELKKRGYNLFIVVHDENWQPEDTPFTTDTARLMWDWKGLFEGDFAIGTNSSDSDACSEN